MGKEMTILVGNRCWLEQSHTLAAANEGYARVNKLGNNITAAITFVEFCSHKQSVLSSQTQKAGHNHNAKKRLPTEKWTARRYDLNRLVHRWKE